MYIKMNDDKSLNITVQTTIYRGENKADMITFLVPAYYEGINVADCAMFMRYISPNGEGKSEVLSYSPEMYKGYLQFNTIVNTRLTENDGPITVWLTAINADEGGVVLKSGEVVVQVSPSKDISDYLSVEDIDQLERLHSEIEILKSQKADNMIYDAEEKALQLTANGEAIGATVDMNDVMDDLVGDLDDPIYFGNDVSTPLQIV